MSNADRPTLDDLSRGKAYWNRQVQLGYRIFSRTVGDDRLQAVLDKIALARQIGSACPTAGPCSRQCVEG
jgi:hypothetical protein